MWHRSHCTSCILAEPDRILVLFVSSLVRVAGQAAAHFTWRRRHVPQPPNERDLRESDFSDARGMLGVEEVSRAREELRQSKISL